MKVTHTTASGKVRTFLESSEIAKMRTARMIFNVGCEWSGVQLNGAYFEANTAMSGGAIASQNRKNLLIDAKNTTFSKNVAVGSRGGAVHISGSGIGARFSQQCLFESNSATSGSGGAVSVEGGASLWISESVGSGNEASGERSTDGVAGGGGGQGGFVFAR